MGGTSVAAGEIEVQHSFLSEIVHNLSQPLTALQCSLELSLFRDQTVNELRASVEAALENAECLRQRLRMLRELNQADDPGDLSLPIELNGLLRELREELLPLFESAGQQFELHLECGTLPVLGNQTKLMRALFYFLEYLFRYSAKEATLSLGVCPTRQRQAEISIATSSCLPVGSAVENEPGSQCSCEIEIARRSFRAAGGDFALISSASGQSLWKATLPLAEGEEAAV
jgi:signal transduction histidine kinase